MDTIFSPTALHGVVPAPASKSEAHRRLICAGLTSGETVISGFMPSGDTEATARCIRALGTKVSLDGDRLTVLGGGAPQDQPLYDCGESGSTLRFFVPLSLALTGGGIFRMRGQLSRRPMDIYRDLFVPQGVDWAMREGADGTAELIVRGSLPNGDYVLPGNVSSQFVSGLLFALPLLKEDSTLRVLPPVESASYITMTVKAIRESGVTLEETGTASWRIPGRQEYKAKSGKIHGDWSQAAVLLCMGALGGDVTVTGIDRSSVQGDRAIVDVLRRLGANVEEDEHSVRVHGGQLRGAAMDMRGTPDIAPIVALVCQMAEGESVLGGCSRLRLKESDRLKITVRMLKQMGGNARVSGERLIIQGVKQLKGGVTLDPAGDHRMVMLASAAALAADSPITVRDQEALAKSWPDYLSVYKALGGKAE
ncbi:MAG: 3-phosphoshikimate 1-carboxyvinyltransferase [Clostridia bacterium]|nr:3-phosphoshikimate 1-carboxyvinyltransferase [Clostridia bacterium]